MPNDYEIAKSRLLARKAEIKHLSEISAEARRTVTLDQQSVGRLSRMDAMQGQVMAEATERKRQIELMRIERALGAIETDEYGLCVSCGEEIAQKRLDIDPSALSCIRCMSGNGRSG